MSFNLVSYSEGVNFGICRKVMCILLNQGLKKGLGQRSVTEEVGRSSRCESK